MTMPQTDDVKLAIPPIAYMARAVVGAGPKVQAVPEVGLRSLPESLPSIGHPGKYDAPRSKSVASEYGAQPKRVASAWNPSTDGNGLNCSTAFTYSGRSATMGVALLFQQVEIQGGAWTLDNGDEHLAAFVNLDSGNSGYYGNLIQGGIWKGGAPGYVDTLPVDQAQMYVEWQQKGTTLNTSSIYYHWTPLGATASWSSKVFRIERFGSSGVNARTVRLLINGVDKTGWIGFLDPVSPTRLVQIGEHYSINSRCDNEYSAFTNSYLGVTGSYPLGSGLGYGHVTTSNYRSSTRNNAQPYCGGETDPNGITWTCNPNS